MIINAACGRKTSTDGKNMLRTAFVVIPRSITPLSRAEVTLIARPGKVQKANDKTRVLVIIP